MELLNNTMRNIYQPTWSGARDKVSLLSANPSAEENDPMRNNNNGMNSSFDTSLSSSRKHEAQQEGDPVQFVPAYHEAVSLDNSPCSVMDETSWDAIASDTHHNRHSFHTTSSNHRNVRKASSVVVTPSSTQRTTTPSRTRRFKCQPALQKQPFEQEEARSTLSHSRSASAAGGGNSRIARLASLFSSRAVVDKASNVAATPSPPPSESSSTYVGWPGTQDKRGGTVVVESSYEESDTGARTASTTSGIRTTKEYHEEVQEAVDRQVQQWMTPDSASETSIPPQPPKPQPPGKYFIGVTDETVDKNSPKTPPRPVVQARAEQEKVHRMRLSPDRTKSSVLDSRMNSAQDVYGREEDSGAIHGDRPSLRHSAEMTIAAETTDPWDDAMSDLSTSYSKTSSAYFNPKEVQAIRKGRTEQLLGVGANHNAAAAVMRRFQQMPPSSSPGRRGRDAPSMHRPSESSQPSSLTEETLAMKDQMDPPRRTFHASVGYRGLLDKTQDVPNLMDGTESDSTSAASAATSRHSSAISGGGAHDKNYRSRRNGRYSSSQRQRVIMEEEDPDMDLGDGTESDVFDGISNSGGAARSLRGNVVPVPEDPEECEGILGATSRAEMEKLNLALLGGGLTTIQTTSDDFANRKTASDFDDNLTNSDCDQYGFTKIPPFHEMVAAGMSQHDRSLSSQSLLFATPTQRARQVLEKHQRTSNNNNRTGGSDSGSSLFPDHYPTDAWGQNVDGDLSQYYVHPDEMKILVKKFRKMSRERYPHLDYEDLEREEDATKAFALSEMRSRIMENDIERGLERRGGTTVVDDIVLTPFNRAALRVRDAVIVAKAWRDGATPQDVINTSMMTRRSERTYYIPRLVMSKRGASKYTWEEVNWVDDLDLSQYRCHSIGPRHLKGSEMFTIGDCQSIQLKLCNEQCEELRAELNAATARQIEAEEAMKEEGEAFDGVMTEAEMTYLTSMEEVKTISHKLVLAEKAFTLVKDRIEKLVAKYEALLVRFENETESVAPSSVFTYESSCYSDDFSFATAEEREKEALARRAQRAEIRAELAAREALLTKQHAHRVREEKEKELKALKMRLAELQSESSAAITEREHSVVLARAITANSRAGGTTSPKRAANTGGNRISRSKIDDVKQRFRDRSAAKASGAGTGPSPEGQHNSTGFYRTVGEEMFQHLDFYERSLKAVGGNR
jgi:hypothetical protein